MKITGRRPEFVFVLFITAIDNMTACIDGGIFCIGLPLLLGLFCPWLFRKKYKLCRRGKCECDKEKKDIH